MGGIFLWATLCDLWHFMTKDSGIFWLVIKIHSQEVFKEPNSLNLYVVYKMGTSREKHQTGVTQHQARCKTTPAIFTHHMFSSMDTLCVRVQTTSCPKFVVREDVGFHNLFTIRRDTATSQSWCHASIYIQKLCHRSQKANTKVVFLIYRKWLSNNKTSGPQMTGHNGIWPEIHVYVDHKITFTVCMLLWVNTCKHSAISMFWSAFCFTLAFEMLHFSKLCTCAFCINFNSPSFHLSWRYSCRGDLLVVLSLW